MSIEGELRRIASNLAASAQAQTSHLQRELFEIEEQKRLVEAKLDAAKLAINRLMRFRPEFDGHFICPNCWFESGRTSKIRPIGGGTATTDLFRCETDKHNFSISIRR